MQNFLEMQCSVDDLVHSLELLIFIIYQYYLMKWIGDPDTKKKILTYHLYGINISLFLKNYFR